MKTPRLDTIILKATSRCCLACDYCSAHAPDLASTSPHTFSPARLLECLAALHDASLLSETLTLIWHGGEPLLLPHDLAGKLMDDLRDFADRRGLSIRFRLQTNAFRLPPGWLQTLARHQVHVGISLDGPQPIHDAARHAPDGSGSYHHALQTLLTLQDHHIPTAILSVIDTRHTGHERDYLDWLANLNITARLNPRFDCSGTGHNDWSTYFSFLRHLFEAALDHPHPFRLQPLDWLLQTLIHGTPPQECAYSGQCGQHLLAFTPDNRIATCGRLADNGGPCADWTPTTIAAQLTYLLDALAHETALLRQESGCDTCPILRCCHGGCPAVRRAEHGQHEFCHQFRNFIAYLAHDGLRQLRQRLQDERRRTASHIDDLQKAMTQHQP
ncbi:MAG: radical SAM protein [Oligosphaeraceae bacterium]